jgi:hypothetical protein
MGHIQPTQNNNNHPCALVQAKIIFFLLSRHVHGHGHVQVYARVGHIKRGGAIDCELHKEKISNRKSDFLIRGVVD